MGILKASLPEPGFRLSGFSKTPGQIASPSWLWMGASERQNSAEPRGVRPLWGCQNPGSDGRRAAGPSPETPWAGEPKIWLLGEHPKALAEEKRRLSRAVERSGDEVDEQATDGLGPWELLRLPAPRCRAVNGENLLLEGFQLGGDPPG